MIPADLLVYVASVEPYDSTAGTFGAPFELPCALQQEMTVHVRDSDPADAALRATIYANLGDDVPAGSRITVDSYGAEVIAVAIHDDKGLTGLSHQEIAVRLWSLTD